MADILSVLPDLLIAPFSHILPSLEKNHITTADILTLDAVDVAKRATVPARDVQKLADAVLQALQSDLGFSSANGNLFLTGTQLVKKWETISTLDEELDSALSGGIPTGYLTEITGESGAGKTQFLLTLLLSCQLPPPHGLSRPTIYISTESALPTNRLSQLVSSHAYLSTLATEAKPSNSKILTISTPDLESQEHILRYQLPVAIKRHSVGLVVIDSITANFRAEFDRTNPNSRDAVQSTTANMARRTTQLEELGALLRDLARKENVAFVVANQVSDRFAPEAPPLPPPIAPASSTDPAPAAAGNASANAPSASAPPSGSAAAAAAAAGRGDPRGQIPDGIMTLNYQQRYFTGWGDESAYLDRQKTPSLGLIWSNQIAARIALTKKPVRGRDAGAPVDEAGQARSRWRRFMRVVFAPWAADVDGGPGVEFTIGSGGVRALESEKSMGVQGEGAEKQGEN